MMLRLLILVTLFVSLLGAKSQAYELPRLQPIAGESAPAMFISLGADGIGHWQPADGTPRDVPLREIVSWGKPAELSRAPIVVLVDGSWLAAGMGPVAFQPGGPLRWSKDRLTLARSEFGEVSLPLEMVRGVLLDLPGSRAACDLALDKLSSDSRPREQEGDLVSLENGDQVLGEITLWNDHLLQMTKGGVKREIPIGHVKAVAFDPALLAQPAVNKSRVLVGLRDGSRIVATAVTRNDQGFHVKPQAGLLVDGQAEWLMPLDGVVFVQPLDGRARYLSDLTADGYKHIPYLTIEWPYLLDRNVLGRQLRADGRLYAKGIGMHSTARLTFKLDGAYRSFESEIAIDDDTRGGGSARFRVFVDAEQRFASQEIVGRMPPVPVRVDVQGAKQLSLIVDFGERADELDHANWLNARLLP